MSDKVREQIKWLVGELLRNTSGNVVMHIVYDERKKRKHKSIKAVRRLLSSQTKRAVLPFHLPISKLLSYTKSRNETR